MATSRTRLSVEAGTGWKEIVLKTEVELKELVVGQQQLKLATTAVNLFLFA